MNNLIFSPDGWSDYLYWQSEDKKTLNRINQLIKDILRNGPSDGIGKPESLRYMQGWSRRIDQKNRLIYTMNNDQLLILSCRGHYDNV